MHNSWGEFYPKGDEYHIPLPGYIRQSAEEQARDNMQAFARRLNEIAQLTAGMPVLQNYLVATLIEGLSSRYPSLPRRLASLAGHPTPYASCEFRSRLEARSAVFFDAAEIKRLRQ